MNTEAIGGRLVARQKVLLERANKVERDASHRDAPLSADFAEQATERENDDVLLALGDEWHHELQDIDHSNRASMHDVCRLGDIRDHFTRGRISNKTMFMRLIVHSTDSLSVRNFIAAKRSFGI